MYRPKELMMKFITALISMFLICGSAAASPAQKSVYMVSALLQVPGTTTVNLMQGIQIAASESEAVKIFSVHAKARHPELVIIGTLSSPVSIPVIRDCGISVKLDVHGTVVM